VSDLFTLDIGATSMKWLDVGGSRCHRRTPRPLLPTVLTHFVSEIVPEKATRVVIGFPGIVRDGVVTNAIHLPSPRGGIATATSLDAWDHHPLVAELSHATGRDCLVVNDAELAGFHLIEGRGCELVVTLGTSCAVALFDDGRPQELGDVGATPRQGRSYDEQVGSAAKRRDHEQWRIDVAEVLGELRTTFSPRVIWLSGGNTEESFATTDIVVRPGPSALWGGEAAWRHYRGPGATR
jgi:polyphosphate glucokinase